MPLRQRQEIQEMLRKLGRRRLTPLAPTRERQLREVAAQMEADEKADTRMPLPVRAPRRWRTWLAGQLGMRSRAGVMFDVCFHLRRADA
jgi:hypothetical protein